MRLTEFTSKEEQEKLDEILPALAAVGGVLARGAAAAGGAVVRGAGAAASAIGRGATAVG